MQKVLLFHIQTVSSASSVFAESSGIFVSAEVGSSRRLRDRGVRGGLVSRPALNLAPPPLRPGSAAAASEAGREPGGRESPEGAPGTEAPAGAGTARREQPACSG